MQNLCWQVGLTDEVIRTELVWVRLYRDAMERLQRMAARESQVKEMQKSGINSPVEGKVVYPIIYRVSRTNPR